MAAMMRKMGVKTKEISAREVIIKGEKEILIKNPRILEIEFQGEKSFQITGVVEENEFSEEDIKMVAEKTGKSFEEAKKVLLEEKDLAKAILRLQGD
ncbi:MAG: nascent polypeptide-associated complex protein [archaeon]